MVVDLKILESKVTSFHVDKSFYGYSCKGTIASLGITLLSFSISST